ncbi:hypothetical protein Tco_1212876 [Tanacetum coccineum]
MMTHHPRIANDEDMQWCKDFKKFFRRRESLSEYPMTTKETSKKSRRREGKSKMLQGVWNDKEEEICSWLTSNENFNVKFDETPPPSSPPLVDDDLLEVDIIENQSKDLEVKENEPLNKQISNIKESKDHPLETVIGNLNQRTLRSQVQK